MAKSKNSRSRGPVLHPPHGGGHVHGPNCGCGQLKSKQQQCPNSNSEITREAIDRHWSALPSQARQFILSTPDGMFSLSQLIQFWSRPANVESTQGGIAGSICGATWYLALVYLRLGKVREARALTIHGAFIHQCYNSSLEYIVDLFKNNQMIPEDKLPYFARGCAAMRSPQAMKSYIEAYLPKEYTQMMTSFANLSSKKNVMGYIDQIGDDWKNAGTSNRHHHHNHVHHKRTKDGETKVHVVFVDDADENERHEFDIGSNTELKSLFNDYADKRGVSLRSLRFSYSGSMLFLSSAGHKTPEELGMRDGDVIEVHDTSAKPADQSSSDSDDSSGQKARSSKKSKAKKSKGKNKKSKAKKSQSNQQQAAEPEEKSLEEYKVEHSKRLTKIHEEADESFKAIRQRLNNLVIERTQAKKKSKRPRAPKAEVSLPNFVNNPSKEGLGGKAGKSRFEVQVGEVQNLYKTTKPSSSYNNSIMHPMETLDLHGCTKEEAVRRLDESLEAWVDAAMRGSYPFVRPATIVCGCGNQILSETVAEWIRSTDRVSNAPRFRRQRVLNSRAA